MMQSTVLFQQLYNFCAENPVLGNYQICGKTPINFGILLYGLVLAVIVEPHQFRDYLTGIYTRRSI